MRGEERRRRYLSEDTQRRLQRRAVPLPPPSELVAAAMRRAQEERAQEILDDSLIASGQPGLQPGDMIIGRLPDGALCVMQSDRENRPDHGVAGGRHYEAVGPPRRVMPAGARAARN